MFKIIFTLTRIFTHVRAERDILGPLAALKRMRTFLCDLLHLITASKKGFSCALRLLTLTIGIFLAGQCFAAPCTENTPFSLDLGPVAVRGTDPVGTILTTKRVSWTITCPQGDYYYLMSYKLPLAWITANGKVYGKTNIQGLGYYVTVQPNAYWGNPRTPMAYWNTLTQFEFARGAIPGTQDTNYLPKTPMTFYADVQLVVTERILAGGGGVFNVNAVNNLVYILQSPWDVVEVPSASIIKAATVRFNVPTCAVAPESKVMSINLPDLKSNVVKGTKGKATTFNINLVCSGGVTGSQSNIYISFIDEIDRANGGTTLTNGSSAKGVGVRIANATTGDLVSYAYNAEPTFVTAAGNGTTQITYAAYLYATEDKISSGSVTGMATFTMTYR